RHVGRARAVRRGGRGDRGLARRGRRAPRRPRPRRGRGPGRGAPPRPGPHSRGRPHRGGRFPVPRWQVEAPARLAGGMEPVDTITQGRTSRQSAKVGFVSLGCPKALVDSERILSHLRADGYELVGSYEDAELVVVNTCGFITPAVEESLDAIGEALRETGKVVVTGCLGERPEKVMERHPQVLAVTGQADVAGVMRAVREALPL